MVQYCGPISAVLFYFFKSILACILFFFCILLFFKILIATPEIFAFLLSYALKGTYASDFVAPAYFPESGEWEVLNRHWCVYVCMCVCVSIISL